MGVGPPVPKWPPRLPANYMPTAMPVWYRAFIDRLDPASVFKSVNMEPDDWQIKIMNPCSVRTTLVLCTRQAGKSTGLAGKAVAQARAHPGTTTLLMAPSLRQSAELMRRAADIQHGQQKSFPAKINALSLMYENGSRIFALPGSEETVRGYTAHLLLLDEAAMIPDNLYFSVRPMVATTQGQIIAATTPKGKRGWFYEDWIAEGTPDRRIMVTADDVPRIPRDFLEEEKKKLGEAWFMQEYYCQFNDVVDSLFTTEQLDAITTDLVAPLFGDEEYTGDDEISPLEW